MVCNLIVHHGCLPVIFIRPKNFKYLRSTELLYLKKVVGFANFAKPSLVDRPTFSLNFPYQLLGHSFKARHKDGLLILLFATAISFSQRTDHFYDPYCIVKTRPTESLQLVYQYLLLEGTRV